MCYIDFENDVTGPGVLTSSRSISVLHRLLSLKIYSRFKKKKKKREKWKKKKLHPKRLLRKKRGNNLLPLSLPPNKRKPRAHKQTAGLFT